MFGLVYAHLVLLVQHTKIQIILLQNENGIFVCFPSFKTYICLSLLRVITNKDLTC